MLSEALTDLKLSFCFLIQNNGDYQHGVLTVWYGEHRPESSQWHLSAQDCQGCHHTALLGGEAWVVLGKDRINNKQTLNTFLCFPQELPGAHSTRQYRSELMCLQYGKLPYGKAGTWALDFALYSSTGGIFLNLLYHLFPFTSLQCFFLFPVLLPFCWAPL